MAAALGAAADAIAVTRPRRGRRRASACCASDDAGRAALLLAVRRSAADRGRRPAPVGPSSPAGRAVDAVADVASSARRRTCCRAAAPPAAARRIVVVGTLEDAEDAGRRATRS